MAVITMLTDFGIKDGNVGVMKGVIWGIARDVHIADLSHTISPQNIPEAALVLARSVPYFPDDTVHIVVVDPGVGTQRRPLAAQLGKHFFVGPDNGVITRLLLRSEAEGLPVTFIHLDRSQYWLPQVSHVFHGRDIFAPCGAHLAMGVPLLDMGTPIDDPVRLELPVPARSGSGWRAEILHIDHFGNLATSLRMENLEGQTVKTVRLCGAEIKGMVTAFGERPAGEIVALYGSSGDLIVSVVNGSAARQLSATIGDTVEVELEGLPA